MLRTLYLRWLMFVVASLLVSGSAMAAPVNLASVQAAVAEVGSTELLVSKHADRVVPIASLTKLMTALVVLESGESLDEWLEFLPWHVTPEANAYSRIRIGSTLKRRDLLRLSLMSSENFATYTLARHHPGGYDHFLETMNYRALSLGMTRTWFADPAGLSTQNVSTAADLVRLVNAVQGYPLIGEYSTQGQFTAEFRQPRYRLSYGNTNSLVHRDSWGVTLSKTGYLTDAGRCLVMISEMDGRQVITVLLDSLGTRSPMGDAGRIRRWLASGDPGQVAEAARQYEQERNRHYLTAGGTEDQGTDTATRTEQ